MKQKILLAALAIILCTQCKTREKITFVIPDSYPEARRKEILDICKKGQELYKVHCSDCHGIFTDGKDKVPNFSYVQIDGYGARYLRRDPANHAVAMKMAPDQLASILTFLKFKKRPDGDTTSAARRRM